MSSQVTKKLKPMPVRCSSVKSYASEKLDFVMNPNAKAFNTKISKKQPCQIDNTYRNCITSLPTIVVPPKDRFALNPLATTFTSVTNINCLEGSIGSSLNSYAPPNGNSPTIQTKYVDGHYGDFDNSFMHGCNTSTISISSLNYNSLNDNVSNLCNKENEDDPLQILKKLKIKNLNRLIIGQLNINSIRNKFESLKLLIKGNIDILIITESKLDNTFPLQQFAIEGYSLPFRLDREIGGAEGGGVIIYVRDDIPCRELTHGIADNNIEGIFLEIDLRKIKWLLFGGYNCHKRNIDNFLDYLGPILDHHMCKFDNVILLGDFNCESTELSMNDFCTIYNLKNLIKDPTCFKSPLHPSSIDLILTNKINYFQNSQTVETGLSDHHKMTVTVLKTFFQKQAPITINYRDYKSFDKCKFHTELKLKLSEIHTHNTSYELFESTFMELLNNHAPMKTKYVRANNAPFMNKIISKAIMTRSRLRNTFLKNPNYINKINYNKHRNYCVNLLRKEKRKYYNNIDLKLITDNKKFWKTVKPLFSDKNNMSRKITLIDEEDEIISNDIHVAEIMNDFFANAVLKLDIEGFKPDLNINVANDNIINIISKYKNHPSIIKIKEKVKTNEKFLFRCLIKKKLKLKYIN